MLKDIANLGSLNDGLKALVYYICWYHANKINVRFMYADIISQCSLFAGLSPAKISELLDSVHHTIETFDKGDTLALQDEPCNRLIVLLKGSVKAEMMDPSGRVIKVEDISAPNPLAILFLFGKDNRFPVQPIASGDVTALVLSKQSVLKLLQKNEQLLTNYLNISAHYAATLSRKLHLMSFRTIRQKLSIYLLELTKPDRTKGEFDRTQVALAEYFGVSRPALARELAKMQSDGLIEIDKKNFLITDRKTLIQIISF